MKVELIEDAEVLIPNLEHHNFTESDKIIKKGTQLDGDIKLVEGKRRGLKFTYKLFATKDKQLIYFKKIKPMEVTEVTLGADAQQSATVVNIPMHKRIFTKNAVIYGLIGAGIGFGFSKYKKYKGGKTAMVTSVVAVAGFLFGTYVDKHQSVKIAPSK